MTQWSFHLCTWQEGRHPTYCFCKHFVWVRKQTIQAFLILAGSPFHLNNFGTGPFAQWPGLWMAARLLVTLRWYRLHFLYYVKRIIIMLTSLNLHEKSEEVCIKTRLPVASLPFLGRVSQPRNGSEAISEAWTKTFVTMDCSVDFRWCLFPHSLGQERQYTEKLCGIHPLCCGTVYCVIV